MIIGTVVNSTAIVVGGAAGLVFAALARKRSQADLSQSKTMDGVLKILGLAVVILGIQMAMEPHEFLPVVLSLAIGTAVGELLRIEDRINSLGEWLKKKVGSSTDSFAKGFVSASVLFCVGATAVVGSLKDGISNDPSLLYVKSIFDGIVSGIFASSMGVGVLFSALPILIYQGTISIAASKITFLMENEIYLNGISVTGGIIIAGIGFNLMQVTKMRIGNTLPALIFIVIYDYIFINFIG